MVEFPKAVCQFCGKEVPEPNVNDHGTCECGAVYEACSPDDIAEVVASWAEYFGINNFDAEEMEKMECRTIRGFDRDEFGNEYLLVFIRQKE